MQTAQDVPIWLTSETTRSEQRITPSWTISHLRTRLEPITGIPPSCQSLTLSTPSGPQSLDSHDGDTTQLSAFALSHQAELHVADTRPRGQRENYTDVSAVTKYEMPVAAYEKLDDSVLAWKKRLRLGRFDPGAATEGEKVARGLEEEVTRRGIGVGRRCRLFADGDGRRGKVAFVGLVENLPGQGVWVGVELDEPTGKNDGSVDGSRMFECARNHGVFVRPQRVEVGDFPPLDDFDDDEF